MPKEKGLLSKAMRAEEKDLEWKTRITKYS